MSGKHLLPFGILLPVSAVCLTALFSGCSSSGNGSGIRVPDTSITASTVRGSRDSTPKVLVPEASGISADGTDIVTVDTSGISKGYVMVRYSGQDKDPKLLIEMPDGSNYYYHLHAAEGYETFPLTAGDGSYSVSILRNISDDRYALEFTETCDVTMDNPLSPYLYPNQYVDFTAESASVAKGAALAYTADDDLTVIGNVYSYVAGTVQYDESEAASVQADYTPSPDTTLATCRGICFDYAALMAAMLRSQGIPTRLEVGYAGTVYHAWVSCYVKEIGWVNGIIQFDGSSWTMMDPTFAASKGEKGVQDYIGSGTNYQTKYIY